MPDSNSWRRVSIEDSTPSLVGQWMHVEAQSKPAADGRSIGIQRVEGVVIEHRDQAVWIADREGHFHRFGVDTHDFAETNASLLGGGISSAVEFYGVKDLLLALSKYPQGIFFLRLPLVSQMQDPFRVASTDMHLVVARAQVDRSNRREPQLVLLDPREEQESVRVPIAYLEQFESSAAISGFALTDTAWRSAAWPEAYERKGFSDLRSQSADVPAVLQKIRHSFYPSQKVDHSHRFESAPIQGFEQLLSGSDLVVRDADIEPLRQQSQLPEDLQVDAVLTLLRDWDHQAAADEGEESGALERRIAIEFLQKQFLMSVIGVYAGYPGLQASFKLTDESVFYLTTLAGLPLKRSVKIKQIKEPLSIEGVVGRRARIPADDDWIEYDIEEEKRVGAWSLWQIRVRFVEE